MSGQQLSRDTCSELGHPGRAGREAGDLISVDSESSELALLCAELRGCCKDVTCRIARMSDNLDHQLKMLGLLRDMSLSKKC